MIKMFVAVGLVTAVFVSAPAAGHSWQVGNDS